MFAYVWPIALVVFSNVAYQICAKEVPARLNPFAALTITYLVGAVASAIFYFVMQGGNILKEYQYLNWAPFGLGLVVVGLEVGFLYAYKAGWEISRASIVQSSFLAVALLLAGAAIYHEALTWNKIAGIVICLLGLIVINYR